MNRVDILDSTLRDGAQGNGISFSVEDKLNIVRRLDELGVAYIEAGNPGSNPKDLEFFRRASALKLRSSVLVAFGSTRRKGIRVEDDENLKALLTADTEIVAIFGKCWELHVREVIHTTEEENLRMIEDSCRFMAAHGKRVFFDAEHFYDGYRANPEFALRALDAAVAGGACCLVLCDTNGGTFPDEVFEATKKITERFERSAVQIGVHFHNDCGMAVANSVCGVKAGAAHVQGTYLGFGERCGNANLSTIIPDLQLKCGCRCIPDENIHMLTDTAVQVAEISNVSLPEGEPYVGNSAFAHKAGMHADGVLKLSSSFEHVSPDSVGNTRRFLTSEMAGRTVILKKVNAFCPELTKDSPEMADIMKALKEQEHDGYQYEGADSSFELLVRKKMGKYRPFFELMNYKIISGRPSEPGCSASATVKVRVGEKVQLMAAEGNGPVNALDKALRSALEVFYPCLSSAHLIDYKVRVMDGKDATAAHVRVLITSTDGRNMWTTVGVSGDVVEASWLALVDSVEYLLLKNAEGEWACQEEAKLSSAPLS